MHTVPRFLRGPFRRASHVGLEEMSEGHRVNDESRQERGWKLFLLLPRMLLHRPPRGGLISRAKLARFEMFLAPGTEETLVALRRRPAVPRDAIPEHLIRSAPEVPFALDEAQLNKNLRSAKRGAAPGPSGTTVEHLHPLLDHCGDLRMFFAVAELLARGQVPESIQAAVKLGRMTAFTKPEGGVRGIVAGDVVRRLVARTMSQQMMEAVQSATSPFQCAMATRAGCECISHVLQGLTEMNPNTTILSVDGLSACDTISRSAMLQGLSKIEGGHEHVLRKSITISVGGRTGSHAHGPPR